jgi:hypothetical protein
MYLNTVSLREIKKVHAVCVARVDETIEAPECINET